MITEPIIVARHTLSALTEINVDGKIHSLGEYRDFRNHEDLKEFLHEESNISLSWTHLKNNEQHDIHTHDVKSMIIICSGHGILLGDNEFDVLQYFVCSIVFCYFLPH